MLERLRKCREKIDEIDCELIKLLKHREEVVKEIAQCKASLNMTIDQPAREEEIYNRSKEKYIRKIFKVIMDRSKEIQREEFRGSE